jgi:hypothetical protein
LKEEVKKPVLEELKKRNGETEAAYAQMAKEVDPDQLQQVRSISSEANGESCGSAFDVKNPKQPITSNHKDSPEVDMYTFARKNARNLVELVGAVVESVEGPDSPLRKHIA